jgi:carboxymethylenebutenolidase
VPRVAVMASTTIELETSDGGMPLYESVPDHEPGRAVIVVQEAFGVNAHIESICDRLAAVGYRAVAPHVFHRSGGGTAPYDDFSKVMPHFERLTDDAFVVDTGTTIRYLNDLGFDDRSIGTVGFCMGGRVTFLESIEFSLGAAVGFYGGGIVEGRFPQFPALIDRVPEMNTPWLGLFGDQDGSIPVDQVERLRVALADAPVECEVVRYADADHGFNCDARSSYEPACAADAWSRTLAWFQRHLSD